MPELNEPKKVADSAAVIAECDAIEADMAALRAAYEQYFLGLEKRPPIDKHRELTKRVQKMRNTWTRQTAAKFRVQSTAQKFATYERLWAKTIQQIEDGTYVRDLRRLKRRHGDAADGVAKTKKKDADDELMIDEVAPEELLEGGESMEDALAKASAAAVASVSAPKVAPVAPAVPAIAPTISPVAPVAPVAAAQKPGAAPAGAAPKVAPLTPAIPAVAPAAAKPGSSPAVAAVKPGAPSIAPVAGAPRAAAPANATPAPGAAAVRPPSNAPAAPGAARPAAAAPVSGSRPAVAAAAPAAGAPRAAAPAAGGNSQLSDDKLKAVYDAFVKAKKRCNEDTSSMSYEQVATSLRKQVPELMKQHNAKAVEFKVVIKDGKAVLRAVPKDG